MSVGKIIIDYYFLVFVFIGVLGSLILSSYEEIYDSQLVLTDANEFLRCVFMYQIAACYLAKDDIGCAGIIILEIFATLNVWFLNVSIFGIVACFWIIKLIFCLFYIISGKIVRWLNGGDKENNG